MKKLLAIVAICATIFVSCYFASKNFNKSEHTISVVGNGEVYVIPDTLILSLRVEETAPTTAKAQKNANEKIQKIKDIIAQYNIESSNIKSTNVNVYEQYDWRDSGRVSLGYTANHTLEVKIKNANVENEWIASKIISEISEIGGVLINNISYDIFDKAPFYSEARKLAMEKAYQKASNLAEFGWVKLWEPISIIENRSYDYAFANSKLMKMDAYYDTVSEAEVDGWEIELWEMKLILDVSVVYEIK